MNCCHLYTFCALWSNIAIHFYHKYIQFKYNYHVFYGKFYFHNSFSLIIIYILLYNMYKCTSSNSSFQYIRITLYSFMRKKRHNYLIFISCYILFLCLHFYINFTLRTMKNRAPSFRPTCFRPTFFVQSISSNPIRLG